MGEDSLIVRLYFPWPELQKLYDELNAATAAQPLYGEEACEKGFLLFGGERLFLTTNAFDERSDEVKKEAGRLTVYAHDYDPTEIEDCAYWEDPLFPIVGDNSPVFIDAYELLGIAADPPEPGMSPKFLCVDLKKDAIVSAIMFTDEGSNASHLKTLH